MSMFDTGSTSGILGSKITFKLLRHKYDAKLHIINVYIDGSFIDEVIFNETDQNKIKSRVTATHNKWLHILDCLGVKPS